MNHLVVHLKHCKSTMPQIYIHTYIYILRKKKNALNLKRSS